VSEPEFELLPIGALRVHEEVDPDAVRRLAQAIRRAGVVEEPIWVAKGSGVILNGHHRYHALRALGAQRVPAWVLDYEDSRILLGRWNEGDPISKEDVLRHAESGTPYPIKTTRHIVQIQLHPRPTRLEELGGILPEDLGDTSAASNARHA
jgi:L-serine kinase (ADP)